MHAPGVASSLSRRVHCQGADERARVPRAVRVFEDGEGVYLVREQVEVVPLCEAHVRDDRLARVAEPERVVWRGEDHGACALPGGLEAFDGVFEGGECGRGGEIVVRAEVDTDEFRAGARGAVTIEAI